MEAGWLAIREQEESRIDRVEIRNDARHHVLLLGGEALPGGRQNRLVGEDCLLPPQSGFVTVPVYCGEQGRWSQSARGFGRSGILSHPSLRHKVVTGSPQSGVWEEISGHAAASRVASETADYHAVREDAEVRRREDRYIEDFPPWTGRRVCGVVAVWRNRIVACDVFSDAELFQALWPKILRSYVAGILPLESLAAGRSIVHVPDVAGFLEQVAQARFIERPATATGTHVDLRGSVDGAALLWQGGVVHLGVFRPAPPPTVPPPIEPWPRGHTE
jgi:hypothetical protein